MKIARGAQREKQAAEGRRLGREILGLCAIFCGLLAILSLATFDARDPWINHALSNPHIIHNKAGEFGAFLSGSLYDIFGMGAWVVPAFFCLAGARLILGAQPWVWWRWAGFLLMALCICIAGASMDLGNVKIFPRGVDLQGAGDISTHGGGVLGHMLYIGLVGWMNATGTWLVWFCLLLLSVQLLSGMSWINLGGTCGAFLTKSLRELSFRAETFLASRKEARIARIGRREEDSLDLAVIEALPAENGAAENHSLEFAPNAQDPFSALRLQRGPEVAAFMGETPQDPHLPRNGAGSSFTDALESEGFFADLRAGEKTEKAFVDAREDASDTSLVHPALLLLRDEREEEKAGEDATPDALSHTGPAQGDLAGLYGGEPLSLAPQAADARPGDLGASPKARTSTPEDEDFLQTLWRAAGHEAAPPLRADKVIRLDPPAAAAAGKDASSREVPDAGASAEKPSAPAVPIHTIEEIEAAPAAARPGFVNSVLNRMKKPALVPLPSLDMLQDAPSSSASTPRHVLEAKGNALMTCLKDFNIQGELMAITPGPVVTMFEVKPAPGVRVSRIANLSDDLALALKAVAVRIQAPVPGTDTVGIEIPNEIRETVCLKELLGSQMFCRSKSLLTLALGKNIAGAPAVADLATMPHLLVAGATGAGKSVGINSIILSLLYKARPHEVKLLLVDPKRVEMAIYADLPHLVHPVVTEMQLAKNALEWAVAEMEQRYDAIARAGVRNIFDYNAKVASFNGSPPEGMEDLAFMPYLVLIIDELADLMLVAAKEVETSIVRLAQLARAAGIHLILATQRPSVDVVTGLIKANFPCRISFQVTSKHDSRTILDSVGAEHLLGKGDMLFKPPGGKFQRMHGAFVSDRDVHSVVNYWKSQLRPEYQIDFAEWNPEGSGPVFTNGGAGGGGAVAGDPLYTEAVDFVRQQGKASISLIQRKFRIGFNKAARFIEQMEQDGIIGPADGSKPRLVIR